MKNPWHKHKCVTGAAEATERALRECMQWLDLHNMNMFISVKVQLAAWLHAGGLI